MVRYKDRYGFCAYHLCKKKDIMHKCELCGFYFCKQHSEPKPASLPRFRGTSTNDRLIMHEYHRQDAHPCIPYVDHWEKRIQKENERYIAALDKLKEHPYIKKESVDPRKYNSHRHDWRRYNWKKDYPDKKDDYKNHHHDKESYSISIDKTVKIILVIAILITIGWAITKYGSDVVEGATDFAKDISNDNFVKVNPIKAITKPYIDQYKLEQRVHELVNEQRAKNGLVALSYNTKIAEIARGHSQDMATNNFFAHENLKGEDPTDRANNVGLTCRKSYGNYYTYGLAENIFQNNLYSSITYYDYIPSYDWSTLEEIAQSTVNGWMDSTGHRENILTETYNKEGIGVAISNDDKVYITEDFC